jgi:hypothetical protein
VIPVNRLDPVALKIQDLIPRPTSPGNINNLAVVDEVASTTTLPSVKIDQNIGSRNKVSFFWTDWINNCAEELRATVFHSPYPTRERSLRTRTRSG